MALTTIPKDDPGGRYQRAWNDLTFPRRNGEIIGPELPTSYEWNSETRNWWDMWRQSEIAPFLEPSDWHHLFSVAVLYNAFWNPNVKASTKVSLWGEIRISMSGYGSTVLDRLKLRMKFVEPDKHENTPLKKVDYSSLLDI